MVRQVLLLALLDEGRGGVGVRIGRTEDLVAVLAHFKYFKSIIELGVLGDLIWFKELASPPSPGI